MLDRLLTCSLQLTIMGLITGCAVGSILGGYTALLALLGGEPRGGARLAVAISVGVFAYQLCRHRNDLVDR